MNKIYQQKMERYSEEYVFENCERERGVPLVKDAYQNGWHNALQNQWISVEEDLPEVSEYDSYHVMSDHVFATDESLENVIVEWYDNKNKRWYQEWNSGERVQFEITHWMSIPSLEGGEK